MDESLESGKSVNPPHYLRPNPVKRLHEAIEAAKMVKPADYPVKHRRGDGLRLEVDEAKLERIRRHRDREAGVLGIEPTVIATRMVMERLAATNLSEEERADALLDWQRELMGAYL